MKYLITLLAMALIMPLTAQRGITLKQRFQDKKPAHYQHPSTPETPKKSVAYSLDSIHGYYYWEGQFDAEERYIFKKDPIHNKINYSMGKDFSGETEWFHTTIEYDNKGRIYRLNELSREQSENWGPGSIDEYFYDQQDRLIEHNDIFYRYWGSSVTIYKTRHQYFYGTDDIVTDSLTFYRNDTITLKGWADYTYHSPGKPSIIKTYFKDEGLEREQHFTYYPSGKIKSDSVLEKYGENLLFEYKYSYFYNQAGLTTKIEYLNGYVNGETVLDFQEYIYQDNKLFRITQFVEDDSTKEMVPYYKTEYFDGELIPKSNLIYHPWMSYVFDYNAGKFDIEDYYFYEDGAWDMDSRYFYFWGTQQTSITENNAAKQSMQISPNPSADFIKLPLKENYQFEVYNSAGQLMISGTGGQNFQINISRLATGNYHVKVVTKKGSYTGNFIKE